MKNTLTRFPKLVMSSAVCAAALFLSVFSASAVNVIKADVADTLNLSTSWIGGNAPGASDVAVWDHTVVNNLSSSPGGNLDWLGIKILDPSGAITINDDGSSVTLGSSGIDMSSATVSLTLNNPIVLNGDQVWNVAGGQTLAVAGSVSGTNALTLTGSGMITLSGANTYSGGTTLDGAFVEPNNASCFGTSSANVTNINDYLLFDVFPSGGIIANRNYVNGTVTIDMFNRASTSVVLDGAWAGNGTILVTNLATGATLTFGGNGTGGDMDDFTGSVIVSDVNSDGSPSAGFIRFNNGGGSHNVGNAGAIFNFGQGSAQFTEKNSGVTTYFGALIGGPNTQLAKSENYVIGALGLDTTFAGTIQSSSSLNKVGTGTFTLTGNNPYTGATTVSEGTLQVGDGVTAGTGTLGTGDVANNATLMFNRPDDFELTNAITGTGVTIKTNANILTYGGNDTASGTFLIGQGTLALNSVGSISSSIFVADGANFDVSQNPAFTLVSTLSGFGGVTGNLTASQGSISPGDIGAAGTLTFSNGLNETGGVINQIELSSPGGVNDQIVVMGDLNLSGLNPIVVNGLGDGTIPVGTYTLISYTGNLIGGTNNLGISISGGFGTLTNPPGQIALIVTPPPRPPANLTWVGDGLGNAWDINVSTDWESNSTPLTFLNGDSVTFDSTGVANPIVNVARTLLPDSVTVDASSDYTFTGNGDISGTTGLTKTNSGTLTILTTNTYTGPTIIAGGALAVSDLENGTLPSSIGAADSDPANLVFDGSTLDFLGGANATDRGMTLNGAGVNINVVDSGANLTLNGPLSGPGALTVSGPGTLTIGGANSFTGGTVISNGVLALGSNAANSSGDQSGVGPTDSPVTFYGGTLQLFGFNGSTSPTYNSFYNPLIVPEGQTGTLQLFCRASGLYSTLTGGGTLNLVVNYLRDELVGDWSAFTGTINVTPKGSGSGDEMRIHNTHGYANATIFLNDGVLMDSLVSSATINIGALGGTSGAIIGPGSKSSKNPTWVVGWKNTTNTFDGSIEDDGVSSVIKVGTGEWILTGQNAYSGSTVVSNGVLALASGTFGDAYVGSSTNFFIASGATLDVSGQSTGTMPVSFGQTLGGSGTVNGILDNTGGGTIAPGDGANIGTLTVTTSINLGGTVVMKINRGNVQNSDNLVSPAISLQGVTVIVTNVGPNLQVGDTFTLFAGALSGSIGSIILPSTDYYTWDTSQLAVNGTISVTAALPPPAISSIDVSGLAEGSIGINASNGAPGGLVNVLSTTNLASPLSDWTTVFSGNFDGSGNLNTTIPVDPTQPEQFYILQAQ